MQPLLEALASGRAAARSGSAPGVRMLPLFCHGLPPSTHTNAYLVGTERIHLLDPGPSDADEQQRLFDVLDALADEGRRSARRRPDASSSRPHRRRGGLCPALRSAGAGPSADGAGRARQGYSAAIPRRRRPARSWRRPASGSDLHAGTRRPAIWRFTIRVYRLLFAGDMVSTLSSVVIAPPEGNLAVYLDSLRRLRTYPARLLLPAHGPPSARPAFTHRRMSGASPACARNNCWRRLSDGAAFGRGTGGRDVSRLTAEDDALCGIAGVGGLAEVERRGPRERGPRWNNVDQDRRTGCVSCRVGCYSPGSLRSRFACNFNAAPPATRAVP